MGLKHVDGTLVSVCFGASNKVCELSGHGQPSSEPSPSLPVLSGCKSEFQLANQEKTGNCGS